jgi:hypothetical protein
MSPSYPRFRGGIVRESIAFASLTFSLFGIAACQQGVVPGNAYDTPYSFSGTVVPSQTIPTTTADESDGGVPQPTRPRMGVLWTDPLQRVPDVPQPARGIESSVSTTLDTFQIDIYGPPPAQAMVSVPIPNGESMRLAYGEIVMIDDQNGDGTFAVSGADAKIASPDRYLAGSNTVLVYLDQTYPSLPDKTLVAVTGEKGYQLIFYACDNETVGMVLVQDPDGGAIASTQPSTTFPDVRACARTHSP